MPKNGDVLPRLTADFPSAFLQNVQGVLNVRNEEFDCVLRRLECLM